MLLSVLLVFEAREVEEVELAFTDSAKTESTERDLTFEANFTCGLLDFGTDLFWPLLLSLLLLVCSSSLPLWSDII